MHSACQLTIIKPIICFGHWWIMEPILMSLLWSGRSTVNITDTLNFFGRSFLVKKYVILHYDIKKVRFSFLNLMHVFFSWIFLISVRGSKTWNEILFCHEKITVYISFHCWWNEVFSFHLLIYYHCFHKIFACANISFRVISFQVVSSGSFVTRDEISFVTMTAMK